jgi:hypothetical protein
MAGRKSALVALLVVLLGDNSISKVDVSTPVFLSCLSFQQGPAVAKGVAIATMMTQQRLPGQQTKRGELLH